MLTRLMPTWAKVQERDGTTFLYLTDEHGAPVEVQLHDGTRTSLANGLARYCSVKHSNDKQGE